MSAALISNLRQMLDVEIASNEALRRENAKLRETIGGLRGTLALQSRSPWRYLPWRGYVS